MENGSAVVKPLVTRTSDGIEDDTFVKRLEEGAPVAPREEAACQIRIKRQNTIFKLYFSLKLRLQGISEANKLGCLLES